MSLLGRKSPPPVYLNESDLVRDAGHLFVKSNKLGFLLQFRICIKCKQVPNELLCPVDDKDWDGPT